MNIVAFCLHLEEYNSINKELLFIAAATTDGTAKAVIGESDGYGIAYYFDNRAEYVKYKGNIDALKISICPYPRYVLFINGSKADSYKVIRGMSIESVIVTEVNLMNKTFIQELRNRMVKAIHPKMFLDMNPDVPNHWIYREYIDNDKINKNYMHTTLEDNPSLSRERIDDIKAQYEPTSIYYRAYILGERVNPEGQIYHLETKNIIQTYDINDYSSYILIADPGESISATVFILMAYNYKTMSLDILREYHHRNNDTSNITHPKMKIDYANDYKTFIDDSINIMKRYPLVIIIDEDIEFYRNLSNLGIEAHYPINSKGVTGKDDELTRITMTQNLLYQNKLRLYQDCSHCITEMTNAVYDDKAKDKGIIKMKDNYDTDGHYDSIDAIHYGLAYYRNIV
jgi:PBSX family phage terminase large subunit